MNPFDKLVDEAAKAPNEEMLDIFRSGWQLGLFYLGTEPFILEDIANALNEGISPEARLKAVEAANRGLMATPEFVGFTHSVAHKRTVLNLGGV